MNYGPLIFLAAFFALATSWCGLVLTPQIQVGRLQQTNTLGSTTTYPVARPGLANQGLAVYRANGCADCHSQQVGQTATVCQIVLNEVGTNRPAVLTALLKLGATNATPQFLASLPQTVLPAVNPSEVDSTIKSLTSAGAKASLAIKPAGPDIARGWGLRRTVAADFLFDNPVLLGSQRIGPDLANLGLRQPDANWHLLHLYGPRIQVKGSAMPTYRFLFETRKIGRTPSPDALALPSGFAPPTGYEVVPTREATALVAYLLSLGPTPPSTRHPSPWLPPLPRHLRGSLPRRSDYPLFGTMSPDSNTLQPAALETSNPKAARRSRPRLADGVALCLAVLGGGLLRP